MSLLYNICKTIQQHVHYKQLQQL